MREDVPATQKRPSLAGGGQGAAEPRKCGWLGFRLGFESGGVGKKRGSGFPEPLFCGAAPYLPRTLSLISFETVNLTAFLAAIFIASPVAGLRPMRALR